MCLKVQISKDQEKSREIKSELKVKCDLKKNLDPLCICWDGNAMVA